MSGIVGKKRRFTGNVTTIHDLAKKITEVFPRDPVVGLQVVVEDVHADDQVTGVERIRFVPALLKNKSIEK